MKLFEEVEKAEVAVEIGYLHLSICCTKALAG